MNTTPDRRVRRTQQAIEQALLSLVVENGYEAVTVRDIIDRADVGRSTFYSHYTDKHDLLLSCLDRIEQLLAPAPGPVTGTGMRFNPGLFAGVAQHSQLYRALTPRRSASALVQARVEALLSEALRSRLAALLPAGHAPAVPLEVVVHSMVGAYQALLSGWLNGDIAGDYSAAAMEEMFQIIADAAISSALDLDIS
ncbi:TetR/AcrR family transcriptional regulator [Arthrobacter castelli]|uniref:TetR/AcrR family transcriptional regulator n=1 Tax=Arthrobacter castelli TaxID=271431 RepID=UPI0004297CFA|nr:TetR/AcrR family transcriptional regulator [Arthrobacter castelli]